jgi:hypothetical protein
MTENTLCPQIRKRKKEKEKEKENWYGKQPPPWRGGSGHEPPPWRGGSGHDS